MIEKPEQHIQTFMDAGADYLSVHIEGNPNIHRTLQSIREHGVHPSIVLNPGTPTSQIQAVLPFVDMVLVMTVNPGFSGQQFIPEMKTKMRLTAALPPRRCPLCRQPVSTSVLQQPRSSRIMAG